MQRMALDCSLAELAPSGIKEIKGGPNDGALGSATRAGRTMLQGEAAKLYSVKPTSDVDLSDPELMTCRDRVLDGQNAWVLFTYAPGSKTRITIRSSGDGAADTFAPLLVDDAVTYGAFRVRTGGENATKYIFLTHVGSSVGAMLRGKVAMHKQDVEAFLGGRIVGGIHIDGDDDASAEAIAARVKETLGVEDISF